MRFLISLAVVLFALPLVGRADSFHLGVGTNYVILYRGTGGHNLQITNVTSNIASEVNPADSLSTALEGLTETPLENNSGSQKIHAPSGTSLFTSGGRSNLVFRINSYSETGGIMLTLNGVPAHDSVVFEFGTSLGNVNLGGEGSLNGRANGQSHSNVSSSDDHVNLNNNSSSHHDLALEGVIHGPGMSMTNASLDGPLFGSDGDTQIVPDPTLTAPVSSVPEPGTLALFGTGLFGFAGFLRRRLRKP